MSLREFVMFLIGFVGSSLLFGLIVFDFKLFDNHVIKIKSLYRTLTQNDWNSNSRLNDISLNAELFEKVRIVCLVMTIPDNHRTRADFVKATWGKRCNKLVFMSSSPDENFDTVNVNVTDGRDFLWIKTRKSFEYAYENHLNDGDWFLKADDDS